MINYHVVRKGDNLSRIAKQYGTTVTELCKLNDLRNPNKIDIGQKIALRKEVVCGFEALILDADRNPIKGTEYILEFCGKSIKGVTGEDGRTRKIMTDWPTDHVRVLVKRFDGSLKEIANLMSGYRNKLATLISPLLVIDTRFKLQPKQAERDKKEQSNPVYGAHNPPKSTKDKSKPGLRPRQASTTDGMPVTVVEGDTPNLDDFLETYTGGTLTQSDVETTARELVCDAGLIFAIAKQESSSSSFIKLGSRSVPTILYERHQFRNRTRQNKTTPSPYEAKYPDICGPAYSRAKKNKKGEWIHYKTGAILAEADVYGVGGIHQYKRLCKAYQLDPSAALQACSWGKFQIMGFNYKAAGFEDIFSFTKAMSRSEAEHIKAFLKFAKTNPTLLEGLRTKNFEKIAEGHNGGNWRAINPEYASNIEKYYNEYRSMKN